MKPKLGATMWQKNLGSSATTFSLNLFERQKIHLFSNKYANFDKEKLLKETLDLLLQHFLELDLK